MKSLFLITALLISLAHPKADEEAGNCGSEKSCERQYDQYDQKFYRGERRQVCHPGARTL
jgi:hypothetical protein